MPIDVDPSLIGWLGEQMQESTGGLVYSDVQYIIPLAEGHSSQAAPGEMVDDQMPIVEAYMATAADGFARHVQGGMSAQRAADMMVEDATLYALRRVVTHTPVDLGVAMGEWHVLLPAGDGGSAVDMGFAPPPKPASESRWRRRTAGTVPIFGG